MFLVHWELALGLYHLHLHVLNLRIIIHSFVHV